MSFYGDIKRVQSSPFVFDKYYSSRAEMEENMNTDNVYIGRYVLIKYTYSEEQVYVKISLNSDTYKPNTYYYSDGSSYILATGEFSSGMTYYTLSNYFNKYDDLVSYSPITLSPDTYIKNVYYKKVNGSYVLCTDTQFNSNTDYFVINKSINEHYVANMSRDVEKYGDTFDGTVWQKIYTNVSSDNQLEKYIMIAELNASVPRIVLDPIAPKYHNSNSSTGESWYEPSIFENVSSEDSYVFRIPDLLKLEIGHMNDNSYAKDLINPQYRYEMYSDGTSSKSTTHAGNAIKLSHEQMLNETNNKVDLAKIRYNEDGVTYYTVDDGDIEGKELTIKLYAFGQLLSDLYDALYGKPATGTGVRPFYVGSPEDVLSNTRVLASVEKSVPATIPAEFVVLVKAFLVFNV